MPTQTDVSAVFAYVSAVKEEGEINTIKVQNKCLYVCVHVCVYVCICVHTVPMYTCVRARVKINK